MLESLEISSKTAWDHEVYSDWPPLLTFVLLVLRLCLVLIHRKFYSRPGWICVFIMMKFLIDYFMFEGVERFSTLSELRNLRMLVALELLYVTASNYMIFSVFYADYRLPPKAIIQFSTLNLIMVITGITMLLQVENPFYYFSTVVAFHVLAIFLYLDKCIGLLKCDTYTTMGKSFIYLSIFIKLIIDNFLRIFYITNLLLNIVEETLTLDRFLYAMQLVNSFVLLLFFILYRRHNSELLGPQFVAAQSKQILCSKNCDPNSEFIFENAAEELMYPAENELNTISDVASEVGCEDVDLEVELQNSEQQRPPTPTVFATEESGRIRVTRNLWRAINKVGSEDQSSQHRV